MGVIRQLISDGLARPGLGEPVPDDAIAYKRWYDRFIAIFAVIAILAIILALIDSELQTANRLAAVAFIMGAMAWFAWRGDWHQLTSDRELVIFLAGLLIFIVLAIRMWDGAGLLLFSAYWLGYAYCKMWPALIYAALLTIASQWAFGVFDNIAWNNLSIWASIILVGFLALLVSGMMVGYIDGFAKESDRRAKLLDELRAAQAELAERERDAGMRQERERLSAEIHDTIAQHFMSIVTNLTAAESRVEHNPRAGREHVDAAMIAARQGITDSRRMVRALAPEILTGRSISEAHKEVATTQHDDAVAVQFEETGQAAQMNRLHEAILVRALQEALVNVSKHSRATEAAVTFVWEEDDVILDISDNGTGFDTTRAMPQDDGSRMGLRAMRTRVESTGGTWMLESSPTEGTSLAISFPTSQTDDGGS